MNTDYLREFVTFAEYMNFTTAARMLNISQPTLSRHVSELERAYGCELVDRSGETLCLTFCGTTLLEKASGLLEAEDALTAGMRVAAQEPKATLVLERYRKSPMIHGLLANAMDELTRRHPGFIAVRRALSPGDRLGESVLRGDVDAGIIACTTDGEPACPVGAPEGFGVLALDAYRERIFFAVPRANPLSEHAGLSLADLAQCCFVFPLNPEFGRCRPDVSKLFERRGLALRCRSCELADVEELGLMKVNADEVFIVVEGAAKNPQSYYLQNPNLAIVPCTDPIFVTRYVLYRKDDDNPALHAFLDILQGMEDAERRQTA